MTLKWKVSILYVSLGSVVVGAICGGCLRAKPANNPHISLFPRRFPKTLLYNEGEAGKADPPRFLENEISCLNSLYQGDEDDGSDDAVEEVAHQAHPLRLADGKDHLIHAQ